MCGAAANVAKSGGCLTKIGCGGVFVVAVSGRQFLAQSFWATHVE
jgi:hypothetical protein